MAVLNRLSHSEIEEKFTHYAWFAWIVPCYFSEEAAGGEHGPQGCVLQVRNWLPEWLLTAATHLYGSFVFLVTLVDDDYEPMWPIALTGPIVKRRTE